MSVLVFLVLFVLVIAGIAAWFARQSARDRGRRSRPSSAAASTRRTLESADWGSESPSRSVSTPTKVSVETYRDAGGYNPAFSVELVARREVVDWEAPERVETERLWTSSSRADPFRIEYSDANGEVTERLINLRGVEQVNDAIYLRAFCRLRAADRSFRCDRILRAWDETTGNQITNPVQYFSRSLPVEDRSDPEHDRVMARVRPGLLILKWICLSDREFSSDEMEVLLGFVASRSEMGRAKSVMWNRARAAAEIDQMRPTLAACLNAVAKMPANGKERALLVAAAGSLVASNDAGTLRRAKRLLGADQIVVRTTGGE